MRPFPENTVLYSVVLIQKSFSSELHLVTEYLLHFYEENFIIAGEEAFFILDFAIERELVFKKMLNNLIPLAFQHSLHALWTKPCMGKLAHGTAKVQKSHITPQTKVWESHRN